MGLHFIVSNIVLLLFKLKVKDNINSTLYTWSTNVARIRKILTHKTRFALVLRVFTVILIVILLTQCAIYIQLRWSLAESLCYIQTTFIPHSSHIHTTFIPQKAHIETTAHYLEHPQFELQLQVTVKQVLYNFIA